ncbi:MAG: type IV pili methyl-accepting chemotaxis transducer N-terminal domain-containing protein, partial [Gammaproteobacteria bacterium]|nr:type IV pili methyl-accepting chemotaxis transducer N-terminal domain-containing protein [Gammaproteobacteria bacterium]
MLSKEASLLAVYEFTGVIENAAPQVQAQLEQAVKVLVDKAANEQQLAHTAQQLMLMERMRASIQQILLGGEPANDAAARFARDARQFDQTLKGLLQGDAQRKIQRVYEADAEALLSRVDKAFEPIRSNVDNIAKIAPALVQGMGGIRQIGQSADALSDAAGRLIGELDRKPGRMQ